MSGVYFYVVGGVDQIWLESHPGHPHAHGRPQFAVVCHTQWPQHMETACLQRADERLWHLYVSNQHRPNEESGKYNIFICFTLVIRAQAEDDLEFILKKTEQNI